MDHIKLIACQAFSINSYKEYQNQDYEMLRQHTF